MKILIQAIINQPLPLKETRTARRGLVLLSISATLLVGCGGSDSDNTDVAPVTPNVFSIPASASQGGKISPAINIVESGYVTSFTVTPDIGYQIDEISGCGGSLTQNTYKTAVINSQCAVTVSFKLSTYKITTQAATGGQISPESIDVSYNTNASFSIATDIGYQIESVTGCNGTLKNNEFETGTITSDCQINATFTLTGDGSLAKRYLDNGDGTITDLLSNQMWMRCSIGQTWQDMSCKGSPSTFDWFYANALAYSDGNYSDWRLPTKDELALLIYCSSGRPSYWKGNGEPCEGNFVSPTIAHTAFPQTPDGPYWTATANGTDQYSGRWLAYFNFGHGRWNQPALNAYVRLVRNKYK
ncbi:Lcl C-terminal domain-containing protein [Shewanella sp.]|jgi:hypothetical protein|uniref:Lcl C-terminal domain-containing protein n=1 Tax=Shewanella sp. TaxID=50422 RepID=UPI00405390F6